MCDIMVVIHPQHISISDIFVAFLTSQRVVAVGHALLRVETFSADCIDASDLQLCWRSSAFAFEQ